MKGKPLPLEDLGSALADQVETFAIRSRMADAETRERVLSAFAPKRRRRAPLLGWAAAAAIVIAAVLLLVLRANDKESAQVRPQRPASHTHAGYSLAFADGSSVVLNDHSQARVVKGAPNGAELALDRGHLEAHVIHRADTAWKVVAGPFTVRVVGTRFALDWEPDRQRLVVAVTEGEVMVEHAALPSHAVRAGERVELTSPTFAPRPPAPSASADADVRDGSSPPRPMERVADASGKPRHADWHALHRAGRYAEAVAAAQAVGFLRLCTTLPAQDLLALASAARLAGETALARDALKALRERFAGSDQAAVAAFTLGRLDNSAAWFETYLQERPSGALACEALGRLLEQRARRSRPEARPTATRYLETCAAGAHSALARSVLDP
jgi:hypothetical protein